MTRPSRDTDLRAELAELHLPLMAIELVRLTVIAITPSALTLVGGTRAQVIGAPAVDLIAPEDRPRAELALTALATGAVDFIKGHGRFIGTRQDELTSTWAAALERGGERLALLQISAGDRSERSPLATFLQAEPLELTVGVVDNDWVITTITSGVERLLGVPGVEMVGRRLLGTVDEHDVDRVLRAAATAKADVSIGLMVRMRTAEESWVDVRAVVGALADSPRRFFILAPEPVGRDIRAAKLEAHLRRIAAELQASGVIELAPSVPSLPDLAVGGLTPRQWEVLTRLLRGERVATIAEELFVSESTVRNHLSAIFEHVGVHSQAELMAVALRQSG